MEKHDEWAGVSWADLLVFGWRRTLPIALLLATLLGFVLGWML